MPIPLFILTEDAYSPVPYPGIVCFNNLQELEDSKLSRGIISYDGLNPWFKLGGGKCYVAQIKDIEVAVQQHDDINLIVANGLSYDYAYVTHMKSQQEIIAAVKKLADTGKAIFALLDGPRNKILSTDVPADYMLNFPATPHAAVFYPWCNRIVPPSVFAALAISKTDRSRGGWKAPCNVPVSGLAPNFPVTDDLQGKFNQGKALNMIRTFPGIGTVLWGARTLDDSDNWRYIPVRRLFNMVEKDIKKALNKLVFEPNNQMTWHRAKAAVDNYLHRLWQEGALSGNKPEEAWFSEIGKDITMTEDDINQGKLIMKIGLAAVRPAEFIILQFTQDLSS